MRLALLVPFVLSAALAAPALAQTPAKPAPAKPAPAKPGQAAKAPAQIPNHPFEADIVTNRGTITVQLWPDKAPKTVANFVAYANDGFYGKTIFHRVVPGFVIQGGGYTADGSEKATKPPIRLEAGESNKKYTLAMARTRDPHSATSQFFVNLDDNAEALDPGARGPGYAVFGRVVRGMDVVEAIAKEPTQNSGGAFTNAPVNPVVIEKVVVRF